MFIDFCNQNIINSKSIDIHDSIFRDFIFIYNKKSIIIKIFVSHPQAHENTIEFHNVIGFEMTSSSFWGESQYILDWEIVDKKSRVLTKRLLKEKRINNYIYSSISADTNYIETIITLKSGDKLIISCEYIIYDESNQQRQS